MADKKKAAPAVEGEEEVDTHRGELGPTYVEIVEKRGGMKKKLTSRVVYVGDVPSGTSVDKVAAHCKSIFGGLNVNGITLVHTDHIVGLIETTPTAAMEAMSELGKDSGPITNINVVCSMEDCPSENFVNFKCKGVTVPAETDVHMDDIVFASHHLYSMMVNIGKNKVDVENSTDLPSQEVCAALGKSKEVQTLEEYLELYDAPIGVSLESELVWPLQPFVQY